MTRKKFVKQLMAAGYDRNTANALAWSLQRAGAVYAEEYARRSPRLRAKMAHREITRAFGKIADAAMAAATVLRDLAVQAFDSLQYAGLRVDFGDIDEVHNMYNADERAEFLKKHFVIGRRPEREATE